VGENWRSLAQPPRLGEHLSTRIAELIGRGEFDRGWCRDGRHAGAGGTVAKHARPTGRGALCRPHGLARRERQKTPGERADPFRQHDPIGVALSHVPEGPHLGAVVSSPHRERPRRSQDHDRGLGAQATDRPVALRAGGRGTGWRLREIFQSSQFSTFPTVSAQSKFASASKSADAQ